MANATRVNSLFSHTSSLEGEKRKREEELKLTLATGVFHVHSFRDSQLFCLLIYLSAYLFTLNESLISAVKVTPFYLGPFGGCTVRCVVIFCLLSFLSVSFSVGLFPSGHLIVINSL